MRNDRKEKRDRRKKTIRKKVFGTPERPRLSVFRSTTNITAQIIDDVNGKTLAYASTSKKTKEANSGNMDGAKKIGEEIAAQAKDKKIDSVVFDRGGYKFHGSVKALADAAREKGLKF